MTDLVLVQQMSRRVDKNIWNIKKVIEKYESSRLYIYSGTKRVKYCVKIVTVKSLTVKIINTKIYTIYLYLAQVSQLQLNGYVIDTSSLWKIFRNRQKCIRSGIKPGSCVEFFLVVCSCGYFFVGMQLSWVFERLFSFHVYAKILRYQIFLDNIYLKWFFGILRLGVFL